MSIVNWTTSTQAAVTDSFLPADKSTLRIDVWEGNRPVGDPWRWEVWTANWSTRIAEGTALDIAHARSLAIHAANKELQRRLEKL